MFRNTSLRLIYSAQVPKTGSVESQKPEMNVLKNYLDVLIRGEKCSLRSLLKSKAPRAKS